MNDERLYALLGRMDAKLDSLQTDIEEVSAAIKGPPGHPKLGLLGRVQGVEAQTGSLMRSRRTVYKLLMASFTAIFSSAGVWIWTRFTGRGG